MRHRQSLSYFKAWRQIWFRFLGSVYLEISEQFTDKVLEFHLHAQRFLESSAGAMSGGTAWADVGFCTLAIGDLELAEDVFQKGLQYPTMFMLLEKPRHLAGTALLAIARDQLDEAVHFADQGRAYAEERRMSHVYPLTELVQGRVRLARGELENSLTSN